MGRPPAKDIDEHETEEERVEREHLEARGKRIAALRRRAGYTTQSALAKVVSDSGSLSEFEGGKRDMNARTAEMLAKALGVSVDVLLNQAPIPMTEYFDKNYPNKNALLSDPEFLSAPRAVRDRVIHANPESGDRTVREWYVVFNAALELEKQGILNPQRDPDATPLAPRPSPRRKR